MDEGRTPIIVTRMEERHEYSKVYPTAFVLAGDFPNIGFKRQWILRNARSRGLERIWLMDDDLHHPQKRDHFKARYQNITWSEWLGAIEDLSIHPSIGLAGGTLRQFGWSEEAASYNTRIGYAVLLRTTGPWNYWPLLHEDTDMNLQVLTKGYKTLRLPQYVFSTGHMGQQEGGCREDYDAGRGTKAAIALRHKWEITHPGLVRLDESKQGVTVTKVDWARFGREGIGEPEEQRQPSG